MTAPIIYTWEEETKHFAEQHEAQRDPLESQKAGHDVYCGLPTNGTYVEVLPEKDGFDRMWNGESWEYVEKKKDPEPEPYVPTEEDKRQQVREYRNYLLQSTDFSQLPDVPMDDAERATYREYREYLRAYCDQDGEWWEENPMDYQTWLIGHHPVK